MQCPSCGFNNLPGLDHCARCLSRLVFNEVEVHPYRASDRGAWRRWWRIRHRGCFRRAYGRLLERVGYRSDSYDADQPDVLMRVAWVSASFIPGLGHLMSGRRRWGLIILASYLALLMGSIVFMSMAWAYCFGILLGLHTYAIVSCLFYKVGYVSRGTSWFAAAFVYLLLWAFIYPMTMGFINRFAQAEVLAPGVPNRFFQHGDVVLVQGQWFRPDRFSAGQIVLYHTTGHHGGNWYLREGFMVERILAGPGDHVVSQNGQLSINGRALPENQGPLANAAFPEKYDLIVPESTYFIYPTMANISAAPLQPQQTVEMRLRIAIIREAQIRGRVVMIISPLGRIGRL